MARDLDGMGLLTQVKRGDDARIQNNNNSSANNSQH